MSIILLNQRIQTQEATKFIFFSLSSLQGFDSDSEIN